MKLIELYISKITEGATDILYHYTNFRAAKNILDTGEFKLSSSSGTDVERMLAVKSKMFFLSTTRSKVGSYHARYGADAAMFVLDGKWIGQRYTVRPVDYYGSISVFDRESEDRIYSHNNTMPITPIIEIHILLTAERSIARDMLISAKRRNIPTFVYSDKKDWLLQNKNKSLSIQSIKDKLIDKEKKKNFYYGNPYLYLTKWLELMTKDNKQQLSKDADKKRYDVLYYSDTYKSLEVDMHNARKPDSNDYENVVKINKYMRQHGLKSIKDLVEFLKNKWRNIQ
jgi:hypothetical protein